MTHPLIHLLSPFALAFALALSGPVHATDTADADAVAQVRQAERDLCAAFERADADWLEQRLDPTFTLTNSRGKVTTAADEVADLRAGTRYDVFRNGDSKVRIYGNAAVVTGITRVEGKNAGTPYVAEFQFTDTYIRKPQGWVMVASHVSPKAD